MQEAGSVPVWVPGAGGQGRLRVGTFEQGLGAGGRRRQKEGRLGSFFPPL